MKVFSVKQWLFLLPLILLMGCAAQRYSRRGDEALSAGRSETAVKYYEQVLEVKPEKADDPEFMAKLTAARRDWAMERGKGHARQGRWDAALTAFEEALDFDPLHTPARNGIEGVRRDASEEYYSQALDRADKGRLAQAETALQRALVYRPALTKARQALDSLEGEGEPQSREGIACRSGQQFLQQKRYEKAQSQFSTLIKIAPYHLPARAGLNEATQQLRGSRALTREGEHRLARGALDDAIEKLQQALQVWPHNAKAAKELQSAREKRARAVHLLAAARGQLANQNWDEAIKTAQQALDIFTTYREARQLVRRANTEAAQAAVHQGQQLLDEDRLLAADQAFRKSLSYRSSYRAAREGLAEIAALQAQRARAAQRWGQALLWFMDANAHSAKEEYRTAMQGLRKRIGERVRKALALVVRDAGNRRSRDAQVLEDRLYRRLEKRMPSIAALDVEAAEVLRIRILDLRIATRLLSSRDELVEYEVETEHPNPQLPALRHRLRSMQHRVNSCEEDHERLVETFADAREQLDGNNPEDQQRLRRLHERREHAEEELADSQRALARAKRALHKAPTTVVEVSVHEWPYTSKKYKKRGSFELRIDMSGIEGAVDPLRKSVDYSVQAVDDEILNANPDVGVNPDPLELPGDDWVYDKLMADAAEDLSKKTARLVLGARVNLWRQTMNQLREASPLDALEAGVNAALILETYNSKAANRLLQSLRSVNNSLATE